MHVCIYKHIHIYTLVDLKMLVAFGVGCDGVLEAVGGDVQQVAP